MKKFRERRLPLVGVVSMLVVLLLVVGSLEFAHLPLINHGRTYSADFADAGGLVDGDVVTVDGVKVGTITHMALRGAAVRVSFTVQDGVPLGSLTSAAAKVLSPIGTEYLELTSSGAGSLQGVIPTSRTTLPYNLVTDLSQLGEQIQQYNIPQLQKALQTGATALSGTSKADVNAAFDGIARLSQVLGNDSSALHTIVAQGAGLAEVLSSKSGQLVDLFDQSNVVLQVLAARKTAIDQLLSSTSQLGADITTILKNNAVPLQGLLASLQSVSKVLAQDSNDISAALPLLGAFGKYAANSTGSGPFVDAALPTLLLPDNVLAQCRPASAYPSSDPRVGCRP